MSSYAKNCLWVVILQQQIACSLIYILTSTWSSPQYARILLTFLVCSRQLAVSSTTHTSHFTLLSSLITHSHSVHTAHREPRSRTHDLRHSSSSLSSAHVLSITEHFTVLLVSCYCSLWNLLDLFPDSTHHHSFKQITCQHHYHNDF
jgi:hypothetical protein